VAWGGVGCGVVWGLAVCDWMPAAAWACGLLCLLIRGEEEREGREDSRGQGWVRRLGRGKRGGGVVRAAGQQGRGRAAGGLDGSGVGPESLWKMTLWRGETNTASRRRGTCKPRIPATSCQFFTTLQKPSSQKGIITEGSGRLTPEVNESWIFTATPFSPRIPKS